MAKTFMQAPKAVNQAVIDGHTSDVPKDGRIEVISETHVETLRRHGFTDSIPDLSVDEIEAQIEAMDDKDELVEFIEERGGEADNSMGFKKLKRLAREAAITTEED